MIYDMTLTSMQILQTLVWPLDLTYVFYWTWVYCIT